MFFETFTDCPAYDAVENDKVFQTGAKVNEEVKRLVQWEKDRFAQLVKVLVRGWSGHKPRRVGISGWLNPECADGEEMR